MWPLRTIHAALSLTSDQLIGISPLRATARMTTIGATAGVDPMTALAFRALAFPERYCVTITVVASDCLGWQSRGPTPGRALEALKAAKGELIDLLVRYRLDTAGGLAGDDLLATLRVRGFAVRRYGVNAALDNTLGGALQRAPTIYLDASNNRIFSAARLMVSAAVVARDARRPAQFRGYDRRRLLALRPFRSCSRVFCPQPEEPAYVVGQIGHADFHPGAGYADRAHHEAHWSFLMREHVLDRAADFGFLRVGDTHALRHRPAWRLLAMDARHEPASREHRFVLR